MEKQERVGVKRLSIYKDENTDDVKHESSGFKNQPKLPFSPGVTVMYLVSDVREKYRKMVKNVTQFQSYAKSTEGTIKLSVIGSALLFGGFAAVQTKSTSKLYRKSLPVLSVTTATAVCFPSQSYEVAKNVSTVSYHGVNALWRNMNKLYSFTQTKISTPQVKAEEEVTYQSSEKGVLKVGNEQTVEGEEKQDSGNTETEEKLELEKKSEINSDKETEKKSETKSVDLSAVVQFIPETIAKDWKPTSVDLGQSSPEDKDLYTTRS
ncbi:uncharacterized protein LOC144744227 [Ciona intestinalis]